MRDHASLSSGTAQVAARSTGLSALSATGANTGLKLSHHYQRPAHRTRLDRACVRVIGVVENVDDPQGSRAEAGESGHQHGVGADA